MAQYDSLLLVVAGVAAGAMIGAVLGFALAARNTAAVDAARGKANYFAHFVNRSLREISLFEWTVHAAIVLNSCLVIFGVAAVPVLVARWLGRLLDWAVLAAYVLASAAFLFGYRFGSRLWFVRP